MENKMFLNRSDRTPQDIVESVTTGAFRRSAAMLDDERSAYRAADAAMRDAIRSNVDGRNDKIVTELNRRCELHRAAVATARANHRPLVEKRSEAVQQALRPMQRAAAMAIRDALPSIAAAIEVLEKCAVEIERAGGGPGSRVMPNICGPLVELTQIHAGE